MGNKGSSNTAHRPMYVLRGVKKKRLFPHLFSLWGGSTVGVKAMMTTELSVLSVSL